MSSPYCNMKAGLAKLSLAMISAVKCSSSPPMSVLSDSVVCTASWITIDRATLSEPFLVHNL